MVAVVAGNGVRGGQVCVGNCPMCRVCAWWGKMQVRAGGAVQCKNAKSKNRTHVL